MSIVRKKAKEIYGTELESNHIDLSKWSKTSEEKKDKLRNRLIQKIYKEKRNYDELVALYKQAKKNGGNDYFSNAVYINSRYSIAQSENDGVDVYLFSPGKICGNNGERLILWDYPILISNLLTQYSGNLKELATNIKKVSVIDFWFSYVIKKSVDELGDYIIQRRTEDVKTILTINHLLEIVIDDHVLFIYKDYNDVCIKKVISETYGYPIEQIVNDLVKMPMLEFGFRYSAYWEN